MGINTLFKFYTFIQIDDSTALCLLSEEMRKTGIAATSGKTWEIHVSPRVAQQTPHR